MHNVTALCGCVVARDSGCNLGNDTVWKMACRYTFDTLNVGDEFESDDVEIDKGPKDVVVRLLLSVSGEYVNQRKERERWGNVVI